VVTQQVLTACLFTQPTSTLRAMEIRLPKQTYWLMAAIYKLKKYQRSLRNNPSTCIIHAKLMEIYAKRRDVSRSLQSDAAHLTRGNGPEWAYICELGRDLIQTTRCTSPADNPLVKGKHRTRARRQLHLTVGLPSRKC
jgi:hypothetical protein